MTNKTVLVVNRFDVDLHKLLHHQHQIDYRGNGAKICAPLTKMKVCGMDVAITLFAKLCDGQIVIK